MLAVPLLLLAAAAAAQQFEHGRLVPGHVEARAAVESPFVKAHRDMLHERARWPECQAAIRALCDDEAQALGDCYDWTRSESRGAYWAAQGRAWQAGQCPKAHGHRFQLEAEFRRGGWRPLPPLDAVDVPPQCAGYYHTVGAGDTLHRVALRTNSRPEDISGKNGLSWEDAHPLRRGRRLKVPSWPHRWDPSPSGGDVEDEGQFPLWAGVNSWDLAQMDAEERGSVLRLFAESKLTVVRVFISRNLKYADARQHLYGYERPVGVYHDAELTKLDALMAECADLGLKLIVALGDYRSEYHDAFGEIEMYSSPHAIDAYKQRVTHILTRVNTVTGREYRDHNDVVLAWDIMNEPAVTWTTLPAEDLAPALRLQLLRNFLAEMATHIKSVDADTLVALGVTGYANYYHGGANADDLIELGDIVDADVYTLHFFGGLLPQWVCDVLPQLRAAGKLLLVEEFGIQNLEGGDAQLERYRSTAADARRMRVPWLFWEYGHSKDPLQWQLDAEDEAWGAVIVPEAERMAGLRTPDSWGV